MLNLYMQTMGNSVKVSVLIGLPMLVWLLLAKTTIDHNF